MSGFVAFQNSDGYNYTVVSQANPLPTTATGVQFVAGSVTVSGTSGAPTLIVAARPGRIRVDLVVEGATTITICSAANSTTGCSLPAVVGEAVSMQTQAAVYAFVGSGSVAVGFIEYF